MLDLVGNPEDRFSHVAAHLEVTETLLAVMINQKVFYCNEQPSEKFYFLIHLNCREICAGIIGAAHEKTGFCTADQRLRFHYMDSLISLLVKFQASSRFLRLTGQFMLDLVNPKTGFLTQRNSFI